MTEMRSHSYPTRGVSLVEALVAMAIMAFGMLALVGVQSTLRENADIAKQRTEATRLAEQAIEEVRNFTTVGSGAATNAEYDSVAVVAKNVTDAASNATYVVGGTVTTLNDRQRSVQVNVTWTDRRGTTQQVSMRDMIARADPILSGLLSAVRSITPVGRREGRHPTIPIRAHDLGDGRSIFKPTEGGTIAWVFNNSTGVITHKCTGVTAASNLLSSGDVTTSCVALTISGQLLAGEVRFNLRGTPSELGDGSSAMKPAPGADVAWVISHASSTIVRVCTVPAATPTASLVPTDVPTGCLPAGAVNVAVNPFAATDATYALGATDSENPNWPSLPLEVTLSSLGGASSYTCISNASTSRLAMTTVTPPQTSVEYFCLIEPTSTAGWSGRSSLAPLAYSDGNTAVWAIGTSVGDYRVCRYTTASTDYTDNLDHPKDYAKWSSTCGTPGNLACRPVTGNLINQNFLVVTGTKACPTDGAANPAAGDLVNSNTLQHQP